MGFQVMTMTDAAAARVRAIIENSGPDARGVRVGIKKGGCAGMEYTIDLVTEPNPKDDLIERDGASVWVDPAAVLYLLGTQMDFETTKLRSGFTFSNPGGGWEYPVYWAAVMVALSFLGDGGWSLARRR